MNSNNPLRTVEEKKEQLKERIKQWKIDNLDKHKQYQKDYQKGEKFKECIKKYQQGDKYKEYKKKYYLKYKDKEKEKSRQWQVNNIDKYKQYQKQYYINKKLQQTQEQQQATSNIYNVENMTVNNYNN